MASTTEDGPDVGTGATSEPTSSSSAESTSTTASSGTTTSGTGTTDSGGTTTSGGTTDSTGTTGPVAVCGDGVVQAGEVCDDGNQDDSDACLVTCSPAKCGDGEVQAGVEACDDGNADDLDACSDACVQASCFDKIANGGETDLDCGGACKQGCKFGLGQRRRRHGAPRRRRLGATPARHPILERARIRSAERLDPAHNIREIGIVLGHQHARVYRKFHPVRAPSWAAGPRGTGSSAVYRLTSPRTRSSRGPRTARRR